MNKAEVKKVVLTLIIGSLAIAAGQQLNDAINKYKAKKALEEAQSLAPPVS
jgi:hypothetical protein